MFIVGWFKVETGKKKKSPKPSRSRCRVQVLRLSFWVWFACFHSHLRTEALRMFRRSDPPGVSSPSCFCHPFKCVDHFVVGHFVGHLSSFWLFSILNNTIRDVFIITALSASLWCCPRWVIVLPKFSSVKIMYCFIDSRKLAPVYPPARTMPSPLRPPGTAFMGRWWLLGTLVLPPCKPRGGGWTPTVHSVSLLLPPPPSSTQPSVS